MDVDVALAEVPVNILPLLDDGDFKTREVAVAFDAAGMDLVWNFVTTSGAFTQTAVTPTSGGNYDWAHQGDGMYTIEIPASGGASINNDTEGFGWFTGVATGVLPWRGPIIGFRPAAINRVLINAQTTLLNLERSAASLHRGSVTGAATLTTLIDSSLTAADNDHYKGRIVIFTTGALAKQATDVTAFNAATDQLTFTQLTQAPSGGDEYVIV